MYKQLTSEQRYAICVLLQQKKSKKEISDIIGVCASTIYRGLKRNATKRGAYNSAFAQTLARERKERLPGNRAIAVGIKDEALRLLREQQWSPEQISGWMKRKGADYRTKRFTKWFGLIRNAETICIKIAATS